MPMRCKKEDCDNTFLSTDPYWEGFCEDCYNDYLEEKEGEDDDLP